MAEYLFDVKFFASVRIEAPSETAARAAIADLDGAEANFGVWYDGTPIVCEVGLDGEADLIEIDGEDPDSEAA